LLLHNDILQGGKNYITYNTKKLEEITPKDLVEKSAKPIFVLKNEVGNVDITEEDTGFYCINSTDFYQKWHFLWKNKEKIITRQDVDFRMLSWSELKDWKHPLNAIVVCDNYIFSTKDKFESNLLPILSELLPCNDLEIPIDITVISYEMYTDVAAINAILNTFIRDTIRLSKFNLSVVKVSRNDSFKNHARNIYTNNFWISSDHSFTFFDINEDVIVPSNVKLISKSLVHTDFNQLKVNLKEIKQFVINSREFYGNKKNRLLGT
jgi:hypothetical protein